MAKQTRLYSLLEALVNLIIGALVALLAQLIWFPSIGYHLTWAEHIATTAFFTLVSLIRLYFVRRWFNGKN